MAEWFFGRTIEIAKFMNDKEFHRLVAKGLGQRVYARLPKMQNYQPE